mgnify:FL=1
MPNHHPHIDALWPGGAFAIPVAQPAERLTTLDNKRVAFVWDNVFRGEEIFPLIERGLRARFQNVECVGYEAFGATFGGDEHAVVAALPERLREHQIDAVISGNGC